MQQLRQKTDQAKCYVVHSPLRQLTIGSNRQCTPTLTSTTLIWSTPWAKSALTTKQLLCPNTWKHFLHDPLPHLHSKQAWHHDQQQFVLWQSNVCSQQNNKQVHSRVELPQRQLAAASGIETYVNHETNTKINLAWTCVLIFDADQRCTHYISKRDRQTQHQRARLVMGKLARDRCLHSNFTTGSHDILHDERNVNLMRPQSGNPRPHQDIRQNHAQHIQPNCLNWRPAQRTNKWHMEINRKSISLLWNI